MGNALLPRSNASTLASTPRPSYNPRQCLECTAWYQPRRHDQIFCGSACNALSKNRELVRGKQAYRALYHSVTCKEADRGAYLSVVMGLARQWRDEDRKAGQPLPPLPEVIQTRILNGMTVDGKAKA